MYIPVVQYSAEPSAVTRLIHPDGVAEYRLTRNVVHEKDNENNDVIQGEEVYFEIAAGAEQPSAADIEKDFGAYWLSGLNWPAQGDAPKTVEERLEEIEADNVTALEGIAELYELLMQ